MAEFEPLFTRISLWHKEGAQIAVLNCREAFDLLGVEKRTFDDSQFIEVGTEFTYDDKKYRVVSVNFVMLPYWHKGTGEPPTYGVNLYSPANVDLDLNCQVNVHVEYA